MFTCQFKMKQKASFCFILLSLTLSGCGQKVIKEYPESTPLYETSSRFSKPAELQNGYGTLKSLTGIENPVYLRHTNEKSSAAALYYIDFLNEYSFILNDQPGNGCSQSNQSACSSSFTEGLPCNFQLYNDKLFYEMSGFSDETNFWIHEIWMCNPDGTDRELLFTVDQAQSDTEPVKGFFFRDNYLYFMDSVNYNLLIYNLDNQTLSRGVDLSSCEEVLGFYQDEEGIYVSAARYKDYTDCVLKILPDQSLELVWDIGDCPYYADSSRILFEQDMDLWFQKAGSDPVKLIDYPGVPIINDQGIAFIAMDNNDKQSTVYYCDLDGNVLDSATEDFPNDFIQLLTDNAIYTRNMIFPIEDGHLGQGILIEDIVAKEGHGL